MENTAAVESALDKAIQLIRAGRKQHAGRELVVLLRQQPDNPQAWWWLANCVESQQHKRDCLVRVLQLDPRHEAARAALEAIARPEAASPNGVLPVTSSQSEQAVEWFNGGREAESAGDYRTAYSSYSRALEIDPTCPEAWLGKGFAAGMLSTPTENRVREFLFCMNRGILANERAGVTAQQAALRMDPSLARLFLDDLLRLCDFVTLLAGRSAPTMANIYFVELVQLTDWAYFLSQSLSTRGGRACARADLIDTALDAYTRIAINIAESTRGPRSRRELLQNFRSLVLSSLERSGLHRDPILLEGLNDVMAEYQ